MRGYQFPLILYQVFTNAFLLLKHNESVCIKIKHTIGTSSVIIIHLKSTISFPATRAARWPYAYPENLLTIRPLLRWHAFLPYGRAPNAWDHQIVLGLGPDSLGFDVAAMFKIGFETEISNLQSYRIEFWDATKAYSTFQTTIYLTVGSRKISP